MFEDKSTGGCYSFPDTSGYWTNLMDSDISTCVTIPRNDNMDVDPMVEMRLNLTCVATHNALFNMAEPLVTLKVTAQGMTSCDKERYLFVEKLNGCAGISLKACTLVADKLDTKNFCEYNCKCEKGPK